MAQSSEIQGCPSLFASLDKASGAVVISNLPEFGKWMLDRSGSPAHWLGEIYDEKKLREPINVVLVDTHATSVEDARRELSRRLPRRVTRSAWVTRPATGRS